MLWTISIFEIVNIFIIQFKSEFNYPGRPSSEGYQIKHMASVRKIFTNLFLLLWFLDLN